MRQKVTAYIRKCQQCRQNKPDRHEVYGQPQAMPVPTVPWDEVTMDFITGLPPSKDPFTKEPYDSILVMVDRLTKYTHFVPIRKNASVKDTA